MAKVRAAPQCSKRKISFPDGSCSLKQLAPPVVGGGKGEGGAAGAAGGERAQQRNPQRRTLHRLRPCAHLGPGNRRRLAGTPPLGLEVRGCNDMVCRAYLIVILSVLIKIIWPDAAQPLALQPKGEARAGVRTSSLRFCRGFAEILQ